MSECRPHPLKQAAELSHWSNDACTTPVSRGCGLQVESLSHAVIRYHGTG